MFIKKGFLIFIGVATCVAVAFGLAASYISDVAAADSGMPTVVIDAGHGGMDNGVKGINTGVDEADVNLAISRVLKSYFSNAGFNAVMTRTTEAGLYGSTEKGFKKRDMQKRKEIIEECNADMVISVHQNFCPLPSKRGGIVFYDKDSESGKILANSIQSELNSMEECATTSTPLSGDYFMLKCTQSPSVIVECGFLSNAEDEKLLCDGEYRKKLAYAIFKGAVGYFS